MLDQSESIDVQLEASAQEEPQTVRIECGVAGLSGEPSPGPEEQALKFEEI
jgi:hypothetical protein